MAYEVLGSEYLGHRQPIVLIGGMSSLRGDWERLATSLAHDRPGDRSLEMCLMSFLTAPL